MNRRTFLKGLAGAVAAAVGTARAKGVAEVPVAAPPPEAPPVGPACYYPPGMATRLNRLRVSSTVCAWVDPKFIVEVNGRPYVEGDTIYEGDVLSCRSTES